MCDYVHCINVKYLSTRHQKHSTVTRCLRQKAGEGLTGKLFVLYVLFWPFWLYQRGFWSDGEDVCDHQYYFSVHKPHLTDKRLSFEQFQENWTLYQSSASWAIAVTTLRSQINVKRLDRFQDVLNNPLTQTSEGKNSKSFPDRCTESM